MPFLPAVVHAEYRGGFRIHLAFNDAFEGIVDFEPWLDGPVFQPLKQLPCFRRFFVEGGTIVWPNGADIAPETLYAAAHATRSNTAMEPSARGSRARRGSSR